MSGLDGVVARIGAPDDAARQAAAERQARLTKPAGALGRLEDVSVWAAGVQGRCPPHPFARVRVVLLAADHGIAAAGVSAYPAEVTAQMVANFLRGGAAVNVLAHHNAAGVRVVDVGVAVDVPGADASMKVRRGSGRIDVEDALTAAELDAALSVGLRLADDEADAGTDLVIPGDMGIGSTTACAAVVAGLLGVEPEAVVGRGTGVNDEGWRRKVDAVAAAVRRADRLETPLDGLRSLGGADLAAMTGLLVGCAARRTPVLLDGVVSATAALVAAAVAPAATAWWLASHRSTEPAQQAALAHLGLEPLLDLGLRLGEGTGALVALPLVQAAIATLAEMATFDEAGVSDRDG
ncbi:MAG: nicotinate-nucleotide--dimethylbenzimidazole phosphoribosyltransferase [Frankiaceae bacterium]|nr:nicotinate-nucleotide--dimethylbenzimidazole phosphoribosyltransferase [Frankiaceae bacterium]